jgi:hypothetical protein
MALLIFKKNKKYTLCMCETKAQAKERTKNWGRTWQCGAHTIQAVQFYVYLGVTITPDLDFTKHISQLKHKLQIQKLEA